MATTTELTLERAQLVLQLAAINTQILAIINSKNKSYTYSNQETTHQAQIQSLDELIKTKRYIVEQISAIDAQLGRGTFIQLKNC